MTARRDIAQGYADQTANAWDRLMAQEAEAEERFEREHPWLFAEDRPAWLRLIEQWDADR